MTKGNLRRVTCWDFSYFLFGVHGVFPPFGVATPFLRPFLGVAGFRSWLRFPLIMETVDHKPGPKQGDRILFTCGQRSFQNAVHADVQTLFYKLFGRYFSLALDELSLSLVVHMPGACGCVFKQETLFATCLKGNE